MHRLRRYDVFRFAQNDVAPVGLNDAMFAKNVAKPRIIRRSRHHWAKPCIICRRQTSFKKRTFVLVDKCSFFVGGDSWKSNRTRLFAASSASLPTSPLFSYSLGLRIGSHPLSISKQKG